MLPQEALGENEFLASSSFRGCLAFFDVWLQVSHSCLLGTLPQPLLCVKISPALLLEEDLSLSTWISRIISPQHP